MPPATPAPALSSALLQQIKQRVDRFEAGWHDGNPPGLEALLAEVPAEARPELFRQLVRLEQEQRPPDRSLTAAECRQRFAALGPWVADVLGLLGLAETADPLTLEVSAGPQTGRSFQLHGHSSFFVGRGPAGVHLALEGDPGISKVHFLVEYNPPRARLSDLRSKNGTYLNGSRVEQAELRHNDEIRVGSTTLKVRLPHDQGTVTTTGEAPAPWPASAASQRKPALPGFDLQEELGRGGMGVVYKARRLSDNAVVAIKMVLPAVAPRPETFDRFQREVRILGQLTHPHIVAFLDSGEVEGLLYFVMEYVEGTDAAWVIKQQGPLPAERVVRLGCQLLEALAHAHLQGFVHRDIKPGNVLLTRLAGQEVLKLADFGLGRAYHESAMSGLTMVGIAGGTPGYIAPEQVLDFHSARPAADQYATAATLYYLLTGKGIYEADGSNLEQLKRVLQTEPRPLRQPPAGPALPGKLGEVLRRGLSREPRQRYPDVLAMREALSRSL